MRKTFTVMVFKCVSCLRTTQYKAEDIGQEEPQEPFLACPHCFSPLVLKTVFLNSKVFPRKDV